MPKFLQQAQQAKLWEPAYSWVLSQNQINKQVRSNRFWVKIYGSCRQSKHLLWSKSWCNWQTSCKHMSMQRSLHRSIQSWLEAENNVEILMCMKDHVIQYCEKYLQMYCRRWWMSSVLGILRPRVQKYHW